MVGEVLVFESEAFSLVPPTDRKGVRYDLPLGDDIADYLKSRIQDTGSEWSIMDPVREDFGSVLLLSREKATFTVTVSWQGDRNWALVFGQMHGCIGWLLRRKPDAETLSEIMSLVERHVFAEPGRFRNARWIGAGEFGGLASAFVIPLDGEDGDASRYEVWRSNRLDENEERPGK
jgi:hypothetical protein